MRKPVSVITALGLAATLLLVPAGVSRANPADTPAAQGDAQVRSKDEVVYANLSADGAVGGVHVVNHFEVTGAGRITDHGGFASLVNLTDTQPLSQQGDAVSFAATPGDFYYQGNMAAAELPWSFQIVYTLDGVPTPPQQLSGKSGKLEIRVATAANPKANPVFHGNYVLQISVTLDRDRCADVRSPGATIASAGKNLVINQTVLPGKDADFAVTAAVQDFVMEGIQITAMPFSMNVELPDTGAMAGDLGKLADAIADFNDGAGELADGAAKLKTGADALLGGSSDFKNGLNKLNGGSGTLTQGSARIRDALAQIAASLGEGLSGGAGLGDLAQLPAGLKQLAQGLKDASGGLAGLKDGLAAANQALQSAMAGIPAPSVSSAQIQALYAKTDPAQHAVLDALVASYQAAQTAKGTYDQVKGAFDAVGPSLGTVSGSLNTIADTLDQTAAQLEEALSGSDLTEQLQQLSEGLTELSKNYSQFHEGLVKYTGGLGKLASGYAGFHSGVASIADGVGDLSAGLGELSDGAGQLRDETAAMSQDMQTEIDRLLDEYTGSDFVPVSFTSPRNQNVSLVQFVLRCEGIEEPEEAEKQQVVEPEKEGVWDRFLALFDAGEK